MVQSETGGEWWQLSPDRRGSYVDGSWSRRATLVGDNPFAFASAVLPDGRVVIAGGEYNFGQRVFSTVAAIYEPQADSWAPLPSPPGWSSIGDAPGVVLADGTFMLGDCCSTLEALLDAGTLSWTATGAGKIDANNEEGWTLLPDGSVLTIDLGYTGHYYGPNPMHAERYLPGSGSWVDAGTPAVDLIGATGEIGPAVLRPDGSVFAIGATGRTAVYQPPASPTDAGSWTAGPDFPTVTIDGQEVQLAQRDGPAALLPNGNVLAPATPPGPQAQPTYFFEFDGTALNPAPAPAGGFLANTFLLLPTGQVMATANSSDIEVYTPAGAADPAWAPHIADAPGSVMRGHSYEISGTLFNGMSQGAAFGDDAQTATNYPLVRMTNSKTGHVFYFRTFDHSSMAVAAVGVPVSTHFTVPKAAETGPAELVVVANGIASNPVRITVK